MASTRIDPVTWRRHAWVNRLQSCLLLATMGVILALLGGLLWGGAGIVALLIAGLVLVLLNPALTPQLIMRMYGARPLTPAQAPFLYTAAHTLARRAELAVTPTIYYVPSRMVNAFAVGHKETSAVALTDGLLRVLDRREQIGVLAHEISHIRSNDMWIMSLADLFSRMTMALSLFGLLLLIASLPLMLLTDISINWLAILILILSPQLNTLAQMGLSRIREYDADLNAARLTGDPEGLARALLKIERVHGRWLEQFFLPGRRIPDPSWLRTHPPTEERVRRLRELSLPPEAELQRLQEAVSSFPDSDRLLRRPHWHLTGLWH